MLGIANISEGNQEALAWAFAQIGGAPPPIDEKDYWDGTPSWLVPFTKFGFMARVSLEKDIEIEGPHNKLPLVRNIFQLRPLASLKAGDFRVDLQPAWNPEISISDFSALDYKIKKSKHPKLDGEGDHNCLYLPFSQSANLPNGFPVVFDPIRTDGSLVTQMLHPNVFDLSPQKRQRPDIQDRLYGHLIQAFAGACDPDQKDLIPEKIDDFLLACRRETESANGILHAHWATEEYESGYSEDEEKSLEEEGMYMNMRVIAESYDTKLSRLPRIQEIMNMDMDIAA